MANPLRKCIALGGTGSLTTPDNPAAGTGDPNDYRFYGNRDYVRNQSQTKWIRIMVDWHYLQDEMGRAPSSWQESWNQLNQAPGGQQALKRLDREIKAANDDGIGVILSLIHYFPLWSSGARLGETDPSEVDLPPERRKRDMQKIPTDLAAGSPWGWFVAHLMARYKVGAPVNPIGPREGAYFGNSTGAFVNVLEVCNEPNHLMWPQENIACAAAMMMDTAAANAYFYGWNTTWQAVFGPATSDYPDTTQTNSASGLIQRTSWVSFTDDVLDVLKDWRPNVYVGWSHHNYVDVRYGPNWNNGIYRAQQVISLLYGKNWRGGGDRLVWLTEGGYNMGSDYSTLTLAQKVARQQTQADLIEANFRAMINIPEVRMWAQYKLNDTVADTFESALRDDFLTNLGQPGATRLSWLRWRNLPGSSGL